MAEGDGRAPIQICNGFNSNDCVEPEALKPARETAPEAANLSFVRMENGSSFPVTCTDRQQEDCQPVCTESLTTGCTEARTPNRPTQDRFEGKYTHK